MSPKSRGRPPARRRKKQPARRPAQRSTGSARLIPLGAGAAALPDEKSDCWFDEPRPGDRRSWAMPPAHGTYRGRDVELLHPDDEGDLTFLIEARHPDLEDAFETGEGMSADGEPFNPRLHVTMHQIVARQLLGDEPPETWQTVQRLAGMGYDWHNIMHMIGALVAEDVHRALTERRRFDARDYARRLNALPGDWPAPEATE